MEEKGMKNINEITLFQSSYDKFKSSYYCLSVILKDSLSQQRLAIIDYLKQKGVGTSIYYPKPIPHFTYYKEKYGYDNNSFPVAAKISYNSIAFPVGPHLDGLDMEYIISTFKKAIMEVK